MTTHKYFVLNSVGTPVQQWDSYAAASERLPSGWTARTVAYRDGEPVGDSNKALVAAYQAYMARPLAERLAEAR